MFCRRARSARLADADRRQASLALLGIESRIQRVTVDDDVYHRVRIGPISNLDSLNRMRKQLRDARHRHDADESPAGDPRGTVRASRP